MCADGYDNAGVNGEGQTDESKGTATQRRKM